MVTNTFRQDQPLTDLQKSSTHPLLPPLLKVWNDLRKYFWVLNTAVSCSPVFSMLLSFFLSPNPLFLPHDSLGAASLTHKHMCTVSMHLQHLHAVRLVGVNSQPCFVTCSQQLGKCVSDVTAHHGARSTAPWMWKHSTSHFHTTTSTPDLQSGRKISNTLQTPPPNFSLWAAVVCTESQQTTKPQHILKTVCTTAHAQERCMLIRTPRQHTYHSQTLVQPHTRFLSVFSYFGVHCRESSSLVPPFCSRCVCDGSLPLFSFRVFSRPYLFVVLWLQRSFVEKMFWMCGCLNLTTSLSPKICDFF